MSPSSELSPPAYRTDLPDPVGRRTLKPPPPGCLDRHMVDREPQRIARRIGDGYVTIDSGWGTVQPIQLAPGVRTIGELELIEHLEAGGLAIDTRVPESVAHGTVPGAVAVPSAEIAEHVEDIVAHAPVVLFCNGPQCVATPHSVHALLEAGAPPEALLYYRGGLHDWISLGYRPGSPSAAPWD